MPSFQLADCTRHVTWQPPDPATILYFDKIQRTSSYHIVYISLGCWCKTEALSLSKYKVHREKYRGIRNKEEKHQRIPLKNCPPSRPSSNPST